MSAGQGSDATEVGEQRISSAETLADANENSFRSASGSIGDEGSEWEFLCECGAVGCQERVFLTLDEYIALRERGGARLAGVVLAKGHRQSQIERSRHLREEAEALKGQAEHQTNRARRNLGIASISRRDQRT